MEENKKEKLTEEERRKKRKQRNARQEKERKHKGEKLIAGETGDKETDKTSKENGEQIGGKTCQKGDKRREETS